MKSFRRLTRTFLAGWWAILVLASSGCASLTNPVANGIPVRDLPTEVFACPKEVEHPLPMHLLRQPQPSAYRLGAGDVLGVYVEDVLDGRNLIPQARVPEKERRSPERGELPSTVGYPVPVRPDGTIHLPNLKPLAVSGKTVEEAEDAVRHAYTVDAKILQPGKARVMVHLQHKRLIRVMVFRRDGPGAVNNNLAVTNVGLFGSGSALIGTEVTGAGFEVALPAYENDLLRALALTGGFPGTNAAREIIIHRGAAGQVRPADVLPVRAKLLPPHLQASPGIVEPSPVKQASLTQGPSDHAGVIRVPLRLLPGEPIPFGPEDVILHDGDVIFVGAAPVHTFYTGGLLPSGEHILPRDYDLDVVEAVTRVRGPLINGAFGGSNLSGVLINPGIGNPSPRLLTVVRRLPDGNTIPIRVDLHLAMVDARERILVQHGDVLILQETYAQALARYFTDVFQIDGIFRIINRRDALSTAAFVVP